MWSAAYPVVTPLTPARPLRFLFAWWSGATADSAAYHREIRANAPERMDALADVARSAADTFRAGDGAALSGLMGRSAELRARLAPLPPAHEQLAATVRGAGLLPNSAGSGGAVAAVVLDDAALDRAAAAVRSLGGDFVVESFGDG